MKAYSNTGYNRTILLTEIDGDELKEMYITISYIGPNSGVKGVTLDKYVIPAILKAINNGVNNGAQ